MLFLKGHGKHVVPDAALQDPEFAGHTCVSEACGFAAGEVPPPLAAETGPFGYFFETAPTMADGTGPTQALDRLAKAMVERPVEGDNNSSIPPVFTYFGQFIDHDVTANTDREAGLSTISENVISAVPRADVAENLGNLRAGALNLDSLYGGGPLQGQIAKDFDRILRHPTLRAKLWLGTDVPVSNEVVPVPDDPARDLLRLRRLVDERIPGFSEADVRNFPRPLRDRFVDPDTDLLIDQRAIVGDGRNDENLFVAQFHLAMLRLHNRVVDSAHRFEGPVGDDDLLYAWAREQVTWIYQWLVVNVYLRRVCDETVVDAVLRDGAPVYADFLARTPPPEPDLLPMPLEFSVAAFRFGHTMVRHSYDWNRFFGRAVGDPTDPNRATFNLMFAFTGNGRPPMFGAPRLPSNWIAEWDRLVSPPPAGMPDRATRKIDTRIAFPLTEMTNERDLPPEIFQNLIRRNLRRGLRLNLPAAQDCIAELNARFGKALPVLSRQDLLSGGTGEALEAGGFVEKTPLWFYVLKEAEVLGSGERLGPLGSTLVAETLVGLAVNDPSSYWHQDGSDPDGRWHPADGAQPENEPVTDLPALMRAALFL